MLFPETLTIGARGQIVSTQDAFHLSLTVGWNFVATPWPSPVDWADSRISFTDGNSALPLSLAVMAGWVRQDLQAYNPQTGTYEQLAPNQLTPDRLEPWNGYLLFASQPVEMVISPPQTQATPPTVMISAPSSANRCEAKGPGR